MYRLLDQVGESHEPVLITGRRCNGILISEEDWKSIAETLYLTSFPGMRESIVQGLRTPLRACSRKLKW